MNLPLLSSAVLCVALLRGSWGQLAAAPTPPPSPAADRVPTHTVPPSMEAVVIYEIFPRSFSAEGTLNGVTAGLDRLETLGVNVLWLMPLNPVGQVQKKGSAGSPYAVQDYYAINPAYGTKDDLRRLVGEAHRRHMRVILDIVANHTSFDSVMMAHTSFYKHDAQGKVLSPYDWTDVAALDYTSGELRRYMTDMLLYWVKEFNLDGFRCDAAGEIPTAFWENARRELDGIHPGLLMLAEASKPELLKSAFDLDYSWPLMASLNEVLEHGAPAGSIESTVEREQARFPHGARHMRMFDDHDEPRALARYGARASLAAAALILTMDGVPMIYNGMEVGDPTESAAPALFEPLKIWWQAGQLRPEFPAFYHFMIPFRKHHPALLEGDLLWVHNSEETHVVSYLRQTAEEQFLVTINLSNSPFRGTVESTGTWEEVRVPLPKERPSTGTAAKRIVDAPTVALPALSLDAFEFRIFRRNLAPSGALPGQ